MDFRYEPWAGTIEKNYGEFNGDFVLPAMAYVLAIPLTALFSYLLGATPFGWLIARARGVDLFQQGSGNIGATNVGRVLGRKFGGICFVLDFAKGAIPVLLAKLIAGWCASPLKPDELGVCAGIAAILGHMFPVYLRFHGGKGVATGAGVVTVLLPLGVVAGLLVWIGVVCAFRYVSLASLAAAVTLCVIRIQSSESPFAREHIVLTLFCFAAAALVAVRHRENIQRLLRGTENRIKESPTMLGFTKTIHILALGLWFGTAIFFSFVVGLALLAQISELASKDSKHQWFAVPAPFSSEKFNEPKTDIEGRHEYASRIFGHAISPMFDWYFLLQGVCGFLAVAAAWGWQYSRPKERIHRRRVTILLLAVATVVVGWGLERYVSGLRHVRHRQVDEYFQNPQSKSELDGAIAAKANFGLWHTISLLVNFGTIGLVTAAMVMAARMPNVLANATDTDNLGGSTKEKEGDAQS